MTDSETLLTQKQRAVLERMPTDDWLSQKALGTSRSVLKGLLAAKLIRKKTRPNPTQDPRLGFYYQRCDES